ncbi:glycosyltransferase [Antarcticimicrobium luteum]|uniref:Glycosyltransferase n=2 Tax=Antarcticimicrobium luteum TaxID=2547397 RepID=A0A4V6PM28_9RHOB|nr:glycosyltransferase [Antarcticimicrobium luteum]
MQLRLNARIGEILVAEGWTTQRAVYAALALQFGLQAVDPLRETPDPDLTTRLPARFWAAHELIPLRRTGGLVEIATAEPHRFGHLRTVLAEVFGPVRPVLATPIQVQSAIARACPIELAEGACTRVPARLSCRGWTPGSRRNIALAMLCGAGVITWAPMASLSLASAMAMLTLLLFMALRLTGGVAHLLSHRHLTAPDPVSPAALSRPHRLPRVSVLVPLYREREIAGALIRRLSRLRYPKALLEVFLVLEEHDATTRRTLARIELPPWMRVLEVPAHRGLTTKPRALNYALDFCRGELIGVWDAEDAPAPDQIDRIVASFSTAAPEVACIQGILDFYNPCTNWRARCFAIEYASWFRVILPGIARLGLVVPLGGTTHFFRRAALEALGGWDAHNVTEDADLGVRLYRAGYRTEMLDTVTYEEAACRPWPWVRQRSRWLKGFMVTYLVHMRHPAQLWSDLGPRRFLGMQAFFLGTLGQFLLAPLIWSFWMLALGLPHPIGPLVPHSVLEAGITLSISAEVLAMLIGLVAVSSPERRFLQGWVPTLTLYYILGIVAVYKAMYELFLKPFYWDKTRHGQVRPDRPRVRTDRLSARSRARSRPASDGS